MIIFLKSPEFNDGPPPVPRPASSIPMYVISTVNQSSCGSCSTSNFLNISFKKISTQILQHQQQQAFSATESSKVRDAFKKVRTFSSASWTRRDAAPDSSVVSLWVVVEDKRDRLWIGWRERVLWLEVITTPTPDASRTSSHRALIMSILHPSTRHALLRSTMLLARESVNLLTRITATLMTKRKDRTRSRFAPCRKCKRDRAVRPHCVLQCVLGLSYVQERCIQAHDSLPEVTLCWWSDGVPIQRRWLRDHRTMEWREGRRFLQDCPRCRVRYRGHAPGIKFD